MKCPHCGKEGRSRVLESRPWDGAQWRRRTCGLCLQNYVSKEITEVGMRMPNETQSRFRAKDPTVKPGQQVITNTGKHLMDLWK